MGPLWLLASALLSCCKSPVPSPPVSLELLLDIILFVWWLVLKTLTLTIEPGNDLPRDTNATLRCRAVVSTSGPQALSRTYRIYRDGTLIYNKTTSSAEDLVYPLAGVRVSNTGKYKCRINIEGQEMTSESSKLKLFSSLPPGLSTPVFHMNKGVFSEGEKVTARCTAPEETGAITFYFYADAKEVMEKRVKSNQAEVELSFSGAGVRRVHCDYTVLLTSDIFKSQESNRFTVTIKELSIKPILKITPVHKIFEGDRLGISCQLEGSHPNQDDLECRLEIGNVVKTATQTLSVIELFSVPVLSVSPSEVFQGDKMLLTCSSEILAADRLPRKEVTYTLDPALSQLREAGQFSGKALPSHFNYTCTALARGIQKRSNPLLVKPKVSVVTPKILAVDPVVLNQPFQIQCVAERGSLPINYTLWKSSDSMNFTVVSQPHQKALFTVTIHKPQEIGQYMCKAANNRQKDEELSKYLNASVIVPLSQATLTVLPSLGDISEGNTLLLICGVFGTPPVTFQWFRSGRSVPLFTKAVNKTTMNHKILDISSDDSDTYYCQARNQADNLVQSQQIPVEGKKEVEAELSVKPPSSKSDDSLTVSLSHDTEVYTAVTDAASHFADMEGRATNGRRDSVASLPADISNRSSYSIPATV
ncbi:hypothetical protein NHX12_017513 [Muraenolepis orangiensis]|uniref:Ig-like domain-containing protein n=1 Tax=Muraenolepis orangiensis TaxID=630683 RepID=A0A9Q0EV18_9TELE|nr:hypothetical protein NHX12_017513 [Muraenolepis orangiensis]